MFRLPFDIVEPREGQQPVPAGWVVRAIAAGEESVEAIESSLQRLEEPLHVVSHAVAHDDTLDFKLLLQVNGHYIERLANGMLEVYEAPVCNDRQMEFELGY